MAVSKIAGPIPGVVKAFPQNIAGKTFANAAALKTALGGAHGVLAPGTSVKITIGQFGPGGNIPYLTGENKKSSFKATTAGGVITITAKKTAKIGSVDRLAIQGGTLPGAPKNKTSFTLEVGIGQIRLG